MMDDSNGRLQVQNKGDRTVDDIRTTDGRRCASQMYQDYRHETENNVDCRLQNNQGEIWVMKMLDKATTTALIMIFVIGLITSVAIAYPPEAIGEKSTTITTLHPIANVLNYGQSGMVWAEDNGITMTDINGIPLHKTNQIGQFGIYEVIGGK
jgi:hypothetical protein